MGVELGHRFSTLLSNEKDFLNLSREILTNVLIGLSSIIYIDILFATCCLLAFEMMRI